VFFSKNVKNRVYLNMDNNVIVNNLSFFSEIVLGGLNIVSLTKVSMFEVLNIYFEEKLMKNIVIINGSPRKESDSENLALKFAELLKSENLKFNTLIYKLNQMNIKNCTGCLTCKITGLCSQTDDMIIIKDSLRKADFVILSSPVHISHTSSLFQNFLERSITDLHTFEYLGKPFVNIISTNGSGEEEADKYMSKMGLLFGMIKVGFAFISKNDAFKEKEFAKLIKKSNDVLTGKYTIKPTLMNKLYFYSMKGIIKDNPEYFVYENKVWKERGWFDRKYNQLKA
jgi:multimeric flavodoxin WrbA